MRKRKYVVRIREIRECRGITQRDLADLLGVTENTIANLEQERSVVPWKCFKICSALNCDINDLVKDSDYFLANRDSPITLQIKQLRERTGLSQKHFAEKVGVSETTVANWENGRAGEQFIKSTLLLCHALECSIAELIEEY